jgi:signal transduction histidine kinase/ActR/RegA family two-component response regulator
MTRLKVIRLHLERQSAAYLILVLSLLATVLVFQRSLQQRQSHRKAGFDRALLKFRNTMGLYFTTAEQELQSLKSLFDASRTVSPDEFKVFVESMGLKEGFSGLYDVGYVMRVRHGQADQHMAFMRNLGFTNHYTPQLSGPNRDHYLVIYRDDFSGSTVRSEGYDVSTEPLRRQAIQAACDTGELAATPRLPVFSQSANQQPTGFVLYAPVYVKGVALDTVSARREAFAGAVYGSVVDAAFWELIHHQATESMLDFEVYEGASPSEQSLRYNSDDVLQALADNRSRSDLQEVVRKTALGSTWSFCFTALPMFNSGPEERFPHLVLLSGLALSVALFGIAWNQAQARIHAEERHKLLEEQIKSSKLEALGVLAGGIAHDFNNILSAIMGNMSLALHMTGLDSDLRECLQEAEKACRRARDLTQQLLTFARGGAPIRRSALLNEIIRDSAKFITSGSKVRCSFDLPEDLWLVQADKSQISQVIQNLVLNSEQAMPEGGTIGIDAANVTLEARNALGLPAGRYVKSSVKDHGIGICPEHLEKIYDPYFTTKELGSGLGLTTVYSIIKRHDGAIAVTSTPDVGTQFDVYLPASEETLGIEPVSRPDQITPKGLVLVMDDEPPVAKTLCLMLKRLGFETVSCLNGADCIHEYQRIEASGRAIAVVILDLTVPGGMGGVETLKRLRAQDPSLRAIVSSGYSNDPVMADYKTHGFQAVVVKPYGMEHLAEALQLATAAEPTSRLA